MDRRVLVTADDFGLHPAINDGIIEAHRRGLVSCASLVACGDAFEHAVEALQRNPSLQIAVHLTLVEERPVRAPSEIPSIVGAAGRFLRDYRQFLRCYLTGRIRTVDLDRELRAQVERILAAGLRPVHLNAHQHLHMLPGVWEVALAIGEEYGIPNLRLSSFQHTFDWRAPAVWPFRASLNALAVRARAVAARRRCVARLVPTVGLDVAGRLRESSLGDVLHSLPAGVHELVAHPGFTTAELQARYRWNYDWSEEVTSLCAISRAELDALGIEVISW